MSAYETRIFTFGVVNDSPNTSLTSQDDSEIKSKGITSNGQSTLITVFETKRNPIAGKTNINSKDITSLPSGVTVQNSNTNSGNTTYSSSRVASAISLPLPEQILLNNSQDWSLDEVGMLDEAGLRILETRNSDGGFTDYIANIYGLTKRKAVEMVKNSAFKASSQRATGISYNPYKEMMYNGVVYRTFAFSWDLYAKNEAEAKEIEEFLFHLEYHAAPDYFLGESLSTFRLPDTFQVRFLNAKLPLLNTLVLTDMNVNYTAENEPKFFHDSRPAYISLSLSFAEMKPRIKTDIKKEYEEMTGRTV